MFQFEIFGVKLGLFYIKVCSEALVLHSYLWGVARKQTGVERRACRAGGRRGGGGAPTPAPRCRPGPGSPAGTPGSVGTELLRTDV